MNEDKIIKTLKAFSVIKPSADFIRRSRPLILAVQQKPRFSYFSRFSEALKLTPAFASAAIFLILILGSFVYFAANQTQLASLDTKELLVEASDLSLNIHLKEAQYFDESVKEVAAVLEKVSGQNSGSLETNQDNQEINQKTSDELIDKAIF